MTATNPETGENFSGEYTGVQEGARAVGFGAGGTRYANAQSDTANAEGVLYGDKGTVLNLQMDIKGGLFSHGMGTAQDNHGNEYQIQF